MSDSTRLIPDNIVRDGFGPMVRPGGALKEVKEQNNGINLSSGDHQALRMSKPGTTLTSAPDAVVRKQMVAESSSVVYGYLPMRRRHSSHICPGRRQPRPKGLPHIQRPRNPDK